MRTYNNNNNSDDDRIYRILHRVLKSQRQGFMVRSNPTLNACGIPMRPRSTACDTPQSCIPDLLLSCETRQMQDAANRTAYYAPAVSALAVGATTPAAPFAAVPAIGALDFLSLQGRARTVYISDFVSSITSLDDMLVIVSVAGVVRFSYNGGRFARANANTSTQACGLYVCAGALETVTITVFNQSAAAFAAAATARIETKTVFAGEPGYMCQQCLPNVVEVEGTCEKCGDDGASASFEEVL